MTNRQKKRLTTYHARLFEDADVANKWLDRMRQKMGNDYTYELERSKVYDMWHAKLYKAEDV